MIELAIEPLTAKAFAPYGEVIETASAAQSFMINEGWTRRFHDLACLDAGDKGRLIASIFRGTPRHVPFTLNMMERHPLGSQTFMPLSHHPYLVVVAPPGQPPRAGDLRAFLATDHQGVNYAPGTWHHPLLALTEECDFLVLDREGPGENCDEYLLEDGPCLISSLATRTTHFYLLQD